MFIFIFSQVWKANTRGDFFYRKIVVDFSMDGRLEDEYDSHTLAQGNHAELYKLKF